MLVTQSCLTATPGPIARQAPLSMEFPKQEILEWVAISFCRGASPPRDRSWSPALQVDSLPSEPRGKVEGGRKKLYPQDVEPQAATHTVSLSEPLVKACARHCSW